MEQLIADVEAYANASGWTPQNVLREAIGAGWGAWAKWKEGTQSPTVRSADRLRHWMAQNPPPESTAPGEAAA